MSKHKVKRYDGEDESMVEADAMEMANKRESLDTGAGPKAMPRRPVSRTPTSEPSRMSGPGRKPTGPAKSDYSNEGRGSKATEARDRFGIPTSLGNAGKNYAPTGKAAESASGSETGRNLEAIGNATGASAAIQGVRRGAAVGKGLAEFAAGRAGAKEAPAAVSAARGAMDRAMAAERAAPKTGDMAKIGDALKAFKNKPAAKSAPKPKPRSKTPAEREAIGRADTMDEYGAAMKRGGSVKKMASGGSASSRGDGIAQRGKTRGTMLCGGGMAKGRK